MPKQIFVNLPVKDLKKSVDFFAKLGFSFNPKFTDNKAACMILGDNMFAMLLVEEFFQNFTKKRISDAKSSTEVLVALAVESREAVDGLVDSAVKTGGKESMDPQDHGWMYSRSFEDLDGHIWEILFADESQFRKS